MEQDNNQNNISISSWKTIDIEINVNEFKNNCNNLKEENINSKDSSEKNSDNNYEIKYKNTHQEEKENGNTKPILENENENIDLNNNPADHGICPGCNCNC